jgi:hypothetical protein
MANIVLKTFAAGDDGQGTVTPQDDALIYQNAVPMNGIFSGATVTLSEANVLHIAAGFGIIGGRFFEINESDITVELSSSGTLLGRLYIHLELTNADVPISINVATGASLPALVGDPDLNINDGAFDLELATFNVSEVTISDIVNTFPTISKANNQLRRATAYSLNDMVLCQSASNSLIFICTTAGTTAIQEPTAYQTVTDGNTVTDGTAVFKAVSVSGQIAELSKTEVLISNTQDALAIVENGDTCTHTGGISKGQYVCWKSNLYTADSNISVGATFASSGGSKNLTAVADGGLNDFCQIDISLALTVDGSKLESINKSLYKMGSMFVCNISGHMRSNITGDFVFATIPTAYAPKAGIGLSVPMVYNGSLTNGGISILSNGNIQTSLGSGTINRQWITVSICWMNA